MTSADGLRDGAVAWLATARREASDGDPHVAFEAARHAAELAAKCLLVRKAGSHPKEHDVASRLQREGLVPKDLDAKALHRLLVRFTLGSYGFDEPVHRRDVQAALRVAERMVAALG